MPALTNQGQLDLNLSCPIDFTFSGVGYLNFTGRIPAESWESPGNGDVLSEDAARTL
jgi:hypothetical protein